MWARHCNGPNCNGWVADTMQDHYYTVTQGDGPENHFCSKQCIRDFFAPDADA